MTSRPVAAGSRRPLGIRATSTLSFAALALAVSSVLAVGTYLTAREVLVDQRESTAARQAFADAALVRDGLLTSGARVSDVLDGTSPPAGAVVLVRRGGQWYSSSLDAGAAAVPADVRRAVADGGAARAWTRLGADPAVVVGVAVPAASAEVYELTPTVELDTTLRTLGAVLTAFALLTTLVGALLGRAASARVVAPLQEVAAAASSISAGRMTTRLAPTTDPDLQGIVESFNTMVARLDERIRRDARFAADVAHELRSPVTTLMTSLAVLRTRADADPRSAAAVDLVDREVRRLHRSLEHLLELGRLEAGVAGSGPEVVDLHDLVAHTLADTHRPADLAVVDAGPHLVVGDKQVLHRSLVNLLDNAEHHGGGIRAVEVRRRGGEVQLRVVDTGPGVAEADRDRVFERFVRIGSRGSAPGTGLGLSLVAESVQAHGGSVRCEATPGGGATFVLAIPVTGHGPGGDAPGGRA